MKCAVCGGGRGIVAEMTDGKYRAPLCDGCRPLVTAMFHIYRSLERAVEEMRQAKQGSKR